MRGQALPGAFVKGAVAEVLQDEPPVPAGGSFVVGRAIHDLNPDAEPMGDIGDVRGAVRRAKEAVRGPEVAQLQKKADLIGWPAQGGDQPAQGLRDGKVLLPLRGVEDWGRVKSALFRWVQKPLAWHGRTPVP